MRLLKPTPFKDVNRIGHRLLADVPGPDGFKTLTDTLLTETFNMFVMDLCAGNSPVTGEFPAQMASIAEKVFIWWRHHDWTVLLIWLLGVGFFQRTTRWWIDNLLLSRFPYHLCAFNDKLQMTGLIWRYFPASQVLNCTECTINFHTLKCWKEYRL